MMYMKRMIISALAIVAMVGCQEKIDTTTELSDVKAKFEGSYIDDTKTVGNSWENGDEVGVFMCDNGVTVTSLEANVGYSVDTYGTFTEIDQPIYYPLEGKVDFYAYYPFQSDMSGTTYLADVTSQSDSGAIDLLTASIVNVDKASDAQSFVFGHALSMVVFNLNVEDNALSLEGLVVTLEGLNSKASFDVLSGEMIAGSASGSDNAITLETVESKVDESVTAVTATAIVLPETTAAGAKLVFTFADGSSLSTKFDSQPFVSGIRRTYNVVVGTGYVVFDSFGITPWGYEKDDTMYETEKVE
ncbi:MAG: fimbrillin family protein [Rikenellaceae bacterium]